MNAIGHSRIYIGGRTYGREGQDWSNWKPYVLVSHDKTEYIKDRISNHYSIKYLNKIENEFKQYNGNLSESDFYLHKTDSQYQMSITYFSEKLKKDWKDLKRYEIHHNNIQKKRVALDKCTTIPTLEETNQIMLKWCNDPHVIDIDEDISLCSKYVCKPSEKTMLPLIERHFSKKKSWEHLLSAVGRNVKESTKSDIKRILGGILQEISEMARSLVTAHPVMINHINNMITNMPKGWLQEVLQTLLDENKKYLWEVKCLYDIIKCCDINTYYLMTMKPPLKKKFINCTYDDEE